MEVVRNIQLKLDVSENDQSVLDEMFEQFRHAAQHVADHGWDDNPHNITKIKNILHHETYSDVREKLTLQSSLVQSARNLAATALGNCKDRIIDEGQKASKPELKRTVVVYNGRTITYTDDYGFSRYGCGSSDRQLRHARQRGRNTVRGLLDGCMGENRSNAPRTRWHVLPPRRREERSRPD